MTAFRSFHASRVFPWLNDKFLAGPALARIRAEALSTARAPWRAADGP